MRTELPKLPPEGLDFIKNTKKPVFLKSLPAVGNCPNCSGWGSVWLQSVTGQFDSAPGGKDILVHHNGKWCTVEDKIYPCPVCRSNTELIKELMIRSGLNEVELDWRLEWLEKFPAKKHAVELAKGLLVQTPEPKGWYCLTGGYGTGKSGILKSLVAAFTKAGVSAIYRTSEKILSEIRSSYGEGEVKEEDIKRHYGSVQFLALDEIDRASSTAWAQATLFGLINSRYDDRFKLCTAMATNLDLEKMPPELGYLASRLKAGHRIILTGDIRGEISY